MHPPSKKKYRAWLCREGWEGKKPNTKHLVFASCNRWTALALREVWVLGNADLGCLWALQVEMPGEQVHLPSLEL